MIQITIQSIQKTTALIALGILTALIEGMTRFGCGLAGLPYE
jgi:hypothetical protein